MATRKAAADTADTAAVAGTASVQTVEGTAITTVEIAPAVASAIANIASIEAALGVLNADNPAVAALTAALDTARGALALAEADAALELQKAAEIEAATAAAANLPAELLTAMLAAIETKYAPAPAVETVAAPAANTIYGRKQVSARTAERNADALAVMAADSSVGVRVADTYNAFVKDWAGDLKGVSAQAGTRYASLVCFAGAGVANVGDYRRLVPQMRQHLLAIGLEAGGATFASDPWLFGFGPHAAGGPKGGDALTLKFRSGAAIAQHADGRFRLTPRGTAGVRFVSSDAAALAAWNGSDAPATPAAAPATPTAPRAMPTPTPPPVQATANGGLTATARCQHCTARNLTTNTECSACGAADWSAA